MSRSAKAQLLLVFITFLWGATFVIVKSVLGSISPLLFNAARMVLAAGLLVAIFARHLKSLSWDALRAGSLVGFFLGLGYTFQTTGLRITTPSKSAFITGLYVILVPIFLAIGWRRIPNRWTLLGVMACLAGLYLMTIPAGSGGTWSFDLSRVNGGDLLTLACAASFALHIIFLGRAMQRFSFEQISVLQIVACAILMFALVPLSRQTYVTWSARVVGAIAVTAVLCTVLAFTLQAWAQQYTSPAQTALIFVLEPVFAGLTSYVVLGERLGLRATLGAALILAGILLSELRSPCEESEREIEPSTSIVEEQNGGSAKRITAESRLK
ncbi:MAG TPA: DMT family transporter [Terriglobales bacterium]|nr:DMT family transporter [Terriglobales bacterium]